MPKTPAYDDWKGRHAIWHQKLRRQDVTVLVKIVDVVDRFDRRDCLIETNTGAQAWVSDKTLKLVPENHISGNFQLVRGKK